MNIKAFFNKSDALPRGVETALLLLLCASIAYWIFLLFGGQRTAVMPRASKAPVTTSDAGTAEAFMDSARLFGSRRPGTLSENIQPLGIVADSRGVGTAIVSVDGQAGRVYRVGDAIDGRIVAAIRADEIELDVNGGREIFRLPARPVAAPVLLEGSRGVWRLGEGAAGAVARGGEGTPEAPSPGTPQADRAPANVPLPSGSEAPLDPTMSRPRSLIQPGG